MEHPLIGDLSHLTEDQLTAKISELNKKLSIAARTGNGHLCNQIRMAIDSHRQQYMAKLDDSQNNSSTDFGNKIDIR